MCGAFAWPIIAGWVEGASLGILRTLSIASMIPNVTFLLLNAAFGHKFKTQPRLIVAMVINLFIPSGGAQWMVQGPIFVEAARGMGVDLPLIVMAIAYGDQLTNLLQPLPAIPLLVLSGLRLKHIMGYSFVFFLVAATILGIGFTLVCFL